MDYMQQYCKSWPLLMAYDKIIDNWVTVGEGG